MSNLRIADPLTINGRVCFNKSDVMSAIGIGAEFNPAEISRYKVVYGVPVVVSPDPLTFNVSVLGVKDFQSEGVNPNHKYSLLTLTEEQATTIIGAALSVGVSFLAEILVFVVKDCPADVLPSVGDAIGPDSDLFKYAATEYPFVNGAMVEHYFDVGGNVMDLSYGLVPLDSLGVPGVKVVALDLIGPYMSSQSIVASGQVPDSVLAMYRYDYSVDDYIQIRVQFPFFTLPGPEAPSPQ